MPITARITSHKYFELTGAHTGVSGSDFQEFLTRYLEKPDQRVIMRLVPVDQVPKYIHIEGDDLDTVDAVFVVYRE